MRKKTGRTAYTVIALLLSVVVVAGCAAELSSAFDEAVVEQSAHDVIGMINDHDSEGLRAMCTPEMASALTDEAFAGIFAAVDEGGAFTEITKMSVVGATDDGVDYATVVAVAEYENKTFTYTISFTEDMKLAGLYYR